MAFADCARMIGVGREVRWASIVRARPRDGRTGALDGGEGVHESREFVRPEVRVAEARRQHVCEGVDRVEFESVVRIGGGRFACGFSRVVAITACRGWLRVRGCACRVAGIALLRVGVGVHVCSFLRRVRRVEQKVGPAGRKANGNSRFVWRMFGCALRARGWEEGGIKGTGRQRREDGRWRIASWRLFMIDPVFIGYCGPRGCARGGASGRLSPIGVGGRRSRKRLLGRCALRGQAGRRRASFGDRRARFVGQRLIRALAVRARSAR